ncbi:MAG: 4a-hydroxytetrahydrobiopterin dehydratase [Candidatus Omnitrophota bacterium]
MSDEKLTQKKCQPCEGGTSPLSREDAQKLLNEAEGWQLNKDATMLYREETLKNFVACVEYIRLIAGVAEEEQHHPDLHLTGYKHLRIELNTHAIGGLSENDFIMAAKINEIPIATES